MVEGVDQLRRWRRRAEVDRGRDDGRQHRHAEPARHALLGLEQAAPPPVSSEEIVEKDAACTGMLHQAMHEPLMKVITRMSQVLVLSSMRLKPQKTVVTPVSPSSISRLGPTMG